MGWLIEISRGIIHNHGYLGIFSLTGMEQFIFPVPADVFIAIGSGSGLVVEKILLVVLAGAVVGSTIGYVFGKYLGHPAARWLFGKKRLDKAESFIKKWGIWGIIVAGLTPIPFKLVTWSAGIFEMPFGKFIAGVIIGRMPRYIFTAYAAEKIIATKFYATTDMSAIILGLVQGLTEFLPISSSGHLVILEQFLHVPLDPSHLVTFDIFLHGGSLIAILIYFWKDWITVLKEVWQMIVTFRLHTQTLAFKLAAGTVPAILGGLFLADVISGNLRTLHSVAFFFVLLSFFYFYTSWKGRKNHVESVSLKKAIIIGLAQAFALIPGVSRAGTTIATGVSLGIKRDSAARFSFMLGGIAILAANVYALSSLGNGAEVPGLKFIAIGTVTSFITSLLAIYLLLRFFQKHTMNAFGIYLLIAGTLILSFL